MGEAHWLALFRLRTWDLVCNISVPGRPQPRAGQCPVDEAASPVPEAALAGSAAARTLIHGGSLLPSSW